MASTLNVQQVATVDAVQVMAINQSITTIDEWTKVVIDVPAAPATVTIDPASFGITVGLHGIIIHTPVAVRLQLVGMVGNLIGKDFSFLGDGTTSVYLSSFTLAGNAGATSATVLLLGT